MKTNQPPPKRQIPISQTGLDQDFTLFFNSGPRQGYLVKPENVRKPWRKSLNPLAFP